ncbi:hypothetical protein LUZ60_015353 [Juncus effusus]|nr:hypothetical protein LUZ60_015353 [Juncus effusus]
MSKTCFFLSHFFLQNESEVLSVSTYSWAIERLPFFNYSLKKPNRSTRLNYSSFSHKRRFVGATQFAYMSQNMEKSQMGPDSNSSCVLPASNDHVEDAIFAIKSGKVIAVPTDTLYGFACDACSAEAVNNIYEIKGRKQTSPLAICVADVADIDKYAIVDHLPNGLLDGILPGPVTLVLKRGQSSELDKSLNPGLASIGIRIPDLDFMRSVARGSQSALALTSANLSGSQSSVKIQDFKDLWAKCELVFDGGEMPAGRAGSTVVDVCTPGLFKILRDGSAKEETREILEKFGLKEAC